MLALKSYSQHIAQNPPELTIAEIDKAKKEKRLTSGRKLLQRANFSAMRRRFVSAARQALNPPGAFSKSSRPDSIAKLPTKTVTDGLEVYRELVDKAGKPVTTHAIGRSR